MTLREQMELNNANRYFLPLIAHPSVAVAMIFSERPLAPALYHEMDGSAKY